MHISKSMIYLEWKNLIYNLRDEIAETYHQHADTSIQTFNKMEKDSLSTELMSRIWQVLEISIFISFPIQVDLKYMNIAVVNSLNINCYRFTNLFWLKLYDNPDHESNAR